MAGRPSLRIGTHGKISRTDLGDGTWLARCRYRDTDGVTRTVERRGPQGDRHGNLAEGVLIEALAQRRPPGRGDITADTKISVLVDRHIERLESCRAPSTVDTYRAVARRLSKVAGGIRVKEVTAGRMDDVLQAVRVAHGAGMAKHARAVLRGALQLAVKAELLPLNSMRDVSSIEAVAPPKGAPALTPDQIKGLLPKLQESEFCQRHDLTDAFTMLFATGLRRSELLGLRWCDFNAEAGTVTVAGTISRITGQGLKRCDVTKSKAGARTLKLPMFAVEMLEKRRCLFAAQGGAGSKCTGSGCANLDGNAQVKGGCTGCTSKSALLTDAGGHGVIFPSTAGTLRDPKNFGRDWRRVRESLGLPDVTTHSFRKTIATLIDGEGLSARIGADHLGHAKISMTQDVYMARNRSHPEVADMLDRIVKSDE